MAPKRTSGAKAPPAKKAKVVAPEAPILDFIGKCSDVPKPCREMLQVSVPICLEVVESERHKFQVQVLDRVAQLIAGVESKKREALSETQGSLAAINAEKEKAAADTSEKTATTDAKKAECDEKEKVVNAAREVFDGAKKVLKEAQKAESGFNAKKAGLLKEQEDSNKLMTDVFEPLKDNTHNKDWRQRNKLITELTKKLSELGAQESLVEALATTLKMTPEKREGTFAKATLDFAQEFFTKHNAKVAQDISSLHAEEASLKAAVAQEETTTAEKKAAYDVVEKEWDAMQEVWIGLDKTRAEAAKTEKQLDAQIPRAQKNIDKASADLEKFLEVPTLFAHLKEKSTAAEAEPEPEGEKQDDEADEAMPEA
jgi:hypothetical protein